MNIKRFPLLLLLLSWTGALAQQRLVSGAIVSAKDGSPIPFVTVKVVGTHKGTTANEQGRFSIQVGPGEALEFSNIGFNSLRLTPAGNTVTVQLTENSTAN